VFLQRPDSGRVLPVFNRDYSGDDGKHRRHDDDGQQRAQVIAVMTLKLPKSELW
jgi:hypothetical protein